MAPRARHLSEADRAAWDAYAQGVRSLPPRRGRAPAQGRAPEPAQPAAQAAPPATFPQASSKAAPSAPPAAAPRPRGLPQPLQPGAAPAGLDRATWQRFLTGRVAVERRLDLHGRTVEAAYHALHGFIHRARADGLRQVEIITGLGQGGGGGAIRAELGHWLNAPALRPLILALAWGNPRNTGSVRLLLRRH